MPSDPHISFAICSRCRGRDHSLALGCHDELVLMMMKTAARDGPLEVKLRRRRRLAHGISHNGPCSYKRTVLPLTGHFLIITVLNSSTDRCP